MERCTLIPMLALGACTGAAELRATGPYEGVDNHSHAKLVVADEAEGEEVGEGEVGLSCEGGASARVETEVEDGTLVVSGDAAEGCVVVVAPEGLVSLVVRGDGDVESDEELVLALEHVDVRGNGEVDLGAVAAETLAIEAGGNGEVRVGALDTASLDLDLRGNGDVALAGAATYAHLAISGGGWFDGSQLVVETLDAELSGSGGATVNVTGTVSADVGAEASLEVTGGATVEATGGGTVTTTL